MQKSFLDYLQAVLWFVLSLVVSCGNDAITKYTGASMSPWQVAFFRCLFGTASLLPFMVYHGSVSFVTYRPWLHVLRGGLLFAAISLWSHGVKAAPITTATLMSFTVPIFVLLLAPLFLQERVTRPMWLATLLGFGGIVLVLQPSYGSFHSAALYLVLAAFLFGLLDVVNKKYVTQEPMLCMLFYSNLVAALCLAWPALSTSSMPSPHALEWLLVLGVGSNLILYFLLRAFTLASASALAPFRYLELLISMGAGYVFFQELPTVHSYLGAAIIIPITLLIVYAQHQKME
ncbi:MAG: DMT family transporter [Bacteroidota bacterium]